MVHDTASARLRWPIVVSAPDIPGHRVLGVLGSGGFATVYRGWQVAVGREVAVKVDNRVLLNDRDRRRFVREVTAAGRLSGHPHVIDVYDAGTLPDGRPFMVMELCPAGSLQDELQRRGPMNPARVREIGIGLADALAAAHQAGILHRDIKPANILVNRFGVVGLSDFGLASIMAGSDVQSATREALTPAYASPEQFRGAEPSVGADVYSLAATLYALLAARPPHYPVDGSQPGLATILAMHDRPPQDILGVPPAMMALLRRSLAPDPSARPPSATVLRDALAACPASLVQGMVPQGAAPPLVSGHPLPPGQYPPFPPDPSLSPGGTPGPGHPSGPGPYGPGSYVPGTTDRGSGRHAATRTPGAGRGSVTQSPGIVTIAAVAAAVVVIVAAVLIGIRLLPGHGSNPGSSGSQGGQASQPLSQGPVPGVFGVLTMTKGCPAASVVGGRARCPAAPECWNGTVDISGSVTAQSLPCQGPHTWQTFAIAILPSDVTTFDHDIVQANPTVRRVCSQSVLLRSRRGQGLRIPASGWEIDVLPPDETAFDDGARAYRCIATPAGDSTPRTSMFGG